MRSSFRDISLVEMSVETLARSSLDVYEVKLKFNLKFEVYLVRKDLKQNVWKSSHIICIQS
jgi:hypothetical protein